MKRIILLTICAALPLLSACSSTRTGGLSSGVGVGGNASGAVGKFQLGVPF